MKKIEKNEMTQNIVNAGNKAKEELGEEIDITIIDYMVIAALEKLKLNERQIKKIYMEG